MAIQKISIRHYRKLAEQEWDDEYTEYDASSLDLAEGIETNKDLFRISFLNSNRRFTGVFSVDDRIKIYLYSTTPTDDDLLFDGLINETEHDISGTNRRFLLRGVNRTQELLSSLVLIQEVENNKNASEVVEEILNQVNNNNQAINGDLRFVGFDTSSVAQTKNDGSAFPTKNFVVNYKPAYDAILQFSDNEYTEDGQYIFWVDSSNVFHWKAKKGVTFDGLTITEGVNAESVNVKRGTYGVYNSVIVDVGKDTHDHGNHILQINTVSILDIGAKWKFLDKSTISPTLMNKNEEANISKFPRETDGSGNVRVTSRVPNSFPFTATFNLLNNGQDLGTPWIISSSATYNDAIRQWAKKLGRAAAVDFLRRQGEVQIKSSVQVNGTLQYTKGQVIKLTSVSADLTDRELRIVDISHSYNSNGWKTTLRLEEDAEE